jgi:hypothetical protein
VDTLASLISSTLGDNDPLDPWLTESNWDENYWDGKAQAIALRANGRMDLAQVRAVIIDILGSLLGYSADGDPGLHEQARRIDRVAQTIMGSLSSTGRNCMDLMALIPDGPTPRRVGRSKGLRMPARGP